MKIRSYSAGIGGIESTSIAILVSWWKGFSCRCQKATGSSHRSGDLDSINRLISQLPGAAKNFLLEEKPRL
jgi:hypothetical protein